MATLNPRDDSSSARAADDRMSAETSTAGPEDVRGTMRVLWAWLQPMLSWLTGRHHRDLPPEPTRSAWFRLCMAQAQLLTGVLLSASSFHVLATGATILSGAAMAMALGVGWLLTVGGARTLQATIGHHLVHENFSKRLSRRQHRILYQLISTVLWFQGFVDYLVDHLKKHHKDPTGPEDPDQVFLDQLGFRAGMRVDELWRHLQWTVVSPVFHGRFLLARIRANFVEPGPARRAGSLLWLAALVGAVTWAHVWLPFLVVWVVPLTVLYHVSALVQFLSEHAWYSVRAAGTKKSEHLAGLTVGRFCGDPAPQIRERTVRWFLAWSRWWVRLVCIHLPVRIAVLVGDLPDHDWHHASAQGDWPNSRARRLAHLRDLADGWPLVEVWGLGAALQRVFVHLSALAVTRPRPQASPSREEGAARGTLGV